MYYKQFNLKVFISSVIIAMSLMACNSNSSSDKIADTAATPAYTTPDSLSAAPADTSSSMPATSADTSAMAASKSSSTTKKKGKASVTFAPVSKNHKVEMDKSGIYEYSEVMPAYPGGQSAIENYVTNSIEYPQTALDEGKEGRVSVAFTIDENGKVTDAHTVSNKLGDGLDEEAVRVVSNMSKWTPGTVKGKPVKARMTLPITFMIQE